MKKLTLGFLILAATTAGATEAKKKAKDNRKPAQSQQEVINATALEIVLGQATTFRTLDGESLARVLAGSIPGPGGNVSISNGCTLNKSDALFKCSIRLTDSSVSKGTKFESQKIINYELEKKDNGMPSESPFNLTITVDIAG